MAELSDAILSAVVPTEGVGEKIETLLLSREVPVREEVEEQMETLFLACEVPVRALENAEPEEGVVGSCSCSAEEERRARRVELLQLRKQCASEEEYETARTRPTWTEVDCTSSSSEDGASFVGEDWLRQNQVHFQSLVVTSPRKRTELFDFLARRPVPFRGDFRTLLTVSPFFSDFEGRVDAGRRIGGGGQAGIYEALFDGQVQEDWVLKVFEATESSLADLQRTWVSEIGNHFVERKWMVEVWSVTSRHCLITNGTLLKDGRFAFVMRRCWGDLRKAIDIEVIKDSTDQNPPFALPISLFLMRHIAVGMKELHAKGILHRDLKAANVLLSCDLQSAIIEVPDQFRFNRCLVADYECCNGVLGTGFWRAPEVLDALKNRVKDIWTNPKIWTKKADVYSYAMTCYEILSGCIPFHNRKLNDYDGVIRGDRPSLPDYIDGEIQELLRKCWHHEREMRPSFEEIEAVLRGYILKNMLCKGLGEDERHWQVLFNEESDGSQSFIHSCISFFENRTLENSGGIRRPKSSHPLSQRRSKPLVPCDLGLNLPGLVPSAKKQATEGESNAI